MDEKLRELIGLHGRHQIPFTVILLDVDHFKPFNDNYGHIEGDRCLTKLARILNNMFNRSGEFVGRYGGEEFVIFISHSDADDARQAAVRIQNAIRQLHYPHVYSEVADYVTVSQGCVTLTPCGNEPIEEVYDFADQALYRTKTNGRDGYMLLDLDQTPPAPSLQQQQAEQG